MLDPTFQHSEKWWLDKIPGISVLPYDLSVYDVGMACHVTKLFLNL